MIVRSTQVSNEQTVNPFHTVPVLGLQVFLNRVEGVLVYHFSECVLNNSARLYIVSFIEIVLHPLIIRTKPRLILPLWPFPITPRERPTYNLTVSERIIGECVFENPVTQYELHIPARR
ncbi:hypothetical protein D3C71_1203040 [compost metagenome]